MNRLLLAFAVIGTLSLASVASAAASPNQAHASCMARFSASTAQSQTRDDLAHTFKELGSSIGFPPGKAASALARDGFFFQASDTGSVTLFCF